MTIAPLALVTVMLFGQVTLGGVVSRVVTVNVQVLGQPCAVAEQVTVVTPTGKTDPEGGTHVTPGATGKVTGTPHSASTLVGQLIWSWLTVTVKLQELELPPISVALHVTVVVPTGKVPPEGGALFEEARPHASENLQM